MRAGASGPSSDGVTKVDVGGKLMKLDDLGPVVLNSDGVRSLRFLILRGAQVKLPLQTLSGTANWETRTLRSLCERNQPE